MPTLTSTQCSELATRIARLQDSYEQLLEGRKARVLVDQNGERIEFNGGNARSLLTYINGLKDEYAKGCNIGTSPIGKPIRPFF